MFSYFSCNSFKYKKLSFRCNKLDKRDTLIKHWQSLFTLIPVWKLNLNWGIEINKKTSSNKTKEKLRKQACIAPGPPSMP